MRYMTSPLDITTDELLVYHQLYLRADLETWVVKYTDRQISDSLAKYGIGRTKVKSILDKFVGLGLLIKIQDGVRGNGSKPAIGRLVKVRDLQTQCNPNVNLMQTNETIENTDVEGVDKPNVNLIQTQCNPLIKEQRTKNKYIYVETSNEYRLAKYLFELIRKNNPTHKEPNLQKWAKHIDYMIRIDKRKVEDIEATIYWCQHHYFWHKNILSTGKLRERYDQLRIQMKPRVNDPQENQGPKYDQDGYEII